MARALLLLAFLASFLGDPRDARALTSAELPPSGRRALAFVYAQAPGVDSQFNAQGQLESLARPLNRNISVEQMTQYAPELNKLRVALNLLGPDALGDQLLDVQIRAHARVREQRYVPALLYSMSDKWALGAMLPIIRRSTSAAAVVGVQNNVAAIARRVGNLEAYQEGLRRLASEAVTGDYISGAIFEGNGYQRPRDFNAAGLGDVELESRWNVLTQGRWRVQWRQNAKFPTTNYHAAVDNLFDRDLAEGDFALKTGAYFDYDVLPGRISLHGGGAARWHAPSRAWKVVPRDATDELPDIKNHSEQIERVRRQLGWDLDSDLAATVATFRGVLSFSVSYLNMLHAQDRYAGQQNLDYAQLAAKSANWNHALEFAVELSTVPLFFAKSFPLPGRLALSVNSPLGGRNGLYAPYGRMDLVVLF